MITAVMEKVGDVFEPEKLVTAAMDMDKTTKIIGRLADFSHQLQTLTQIVAGLKTEMKESIKENQSLKQRVGAYENK